HAGATADARIAIEIDDPVLALLQRINGTDRDARRVRAVIASLHHEHAANVGKESLLDVFDRRAKVPDRDVVFRFARDCTGMTPNTALVINDESVLHRRECNNSNSI
ncbi:MAG TPA: hypothetical protein VL282_15860, partial [Tepidisphaeraceae bacterium]|nr:hypothetical protein [Tepidisphaeraceae bacterium]